MSESKKLRFPCVDTPGDFATVEEVSGCLVIEICAEDQYSAVTIGAATARDLGARLIAWAVVADKSMIEEIES